jgi:hypothetical protein
VCRRSPDRRAGLQASGAIPVRAGCRQAPPIGAGRGRGPVQRRLYARGRRDPTPHRRAVPVAVPALPAAALRRRPRPGARHPGPAQLRAGRQGRPRLPLSAGPRGTGKTSTARILAMALNCEHPVDGEPDGTCASCVAIRRGRRSTSTSSTPPPTASSTRCATCCPGWRSGPRAVEGLHHRRGPPADPGRGQRPAQDPRGAARPRGLRAGHHRPAEGAAHHPQPDPAFRVPAAVCPQKPSS